MTDLPGRGQAVDPKDGARCRLDRWLWATRFFKTRALATEAINGGKVHVNGERVKPARAVRVGDRVRVRKGGDDWEVIVLGLAERRGSATAAQALYDETADSVDIRHIRAIQRRAAGPSRMPAVRPSKKDRRELVRLKQTAGVADSTLPDPADDDTRRS